MALLEAVVVLLLDFFVFSVFSAGVFSSVGASSEGCFAFLDRLTFSVHPSFSAFGASVVWLRLDRVEGVSTAAVVVV